ncbi:hypothetical protein OIU84_014089, partial [Salix udensis]
MYIQSTDLQEKDIATIIFTRKPHYTILITIKYPFTATTPRSNRAAFHSILTFSDYSI